MSLNGQEGFPCFISGLHRPTRVLSIIKTADKHKPIVGSRRRTSRVAGAKPLSFQTAPVQQQIQNWERKAI